MNETSYTDSISYNNFLIDLMVEQQQMEDYVNECIILSSGDNAKVISELAVINEAKIGDKMKALWVRLKSFFSKIYQKFLEKLEAWSTKNNVKAYLDQYKNVILGKKVTLKSVKMQNHFDGTKRIDTCFGNSKSITKAPTSQELADMVTDKKVATGTSDTDKDKDLTTYKLNEQETVCKALGIDSSVIDKSDADAFGPNLTSYFNGGAELEEFNNSTLQDEMKNIFASLYNYEANIDRLKGFKSSYEAGMDNFEKEYNNAVNRIKTLRQDANNEKEYQADKTGSSKVSQELNKVSAEVKKADDSAKTESFAYSVVYNTVLTEAEVSQGSSSSSASNKPNTVKGNGSDPSTAGLDNKEKTINKDSKETSKSIKIDTGKAAETNAKQAGMGQAGDRGINTEQISLLQQFVTDRIRAFSSTRTVVFGSMLNAFTTMRNDYMDIVRAHVQSYLGTVDNKDSDTNEKTAGTGSTQNV